MSERRSRKAGKAAEQVTRTAAFTEGERCCGAVKDAERLGDGQELLREPDGVLDPVVGHDHVVLDPDPEAAGEVDAGLDGDDVAGRERVGALGREPRRLVDVEAEAVSEPVAERAGEVRSPR